MPRVPMLSTPTVELRPITTPRLRPEADTGTVALTALAETAGNVGEFFAREQQRADELRLEDAEAQLRQSLTEAMSDPERGILNQSGVKAQSAEQAFYQTVDQRIAEIENGLANTRQRQLFARRAQQLRTDIQGRVNSHISNEMERVDAAAYEANVAGTLDAIANKAKKGVDAEADITELGRRATLYGDRRGLPPEAIEQARQATVSRARMVQMQALVDAGFPDRAQAILEDNRNTLTVEDRARAADWVQGGQKAARAQAEEDRIMAAHPNDPIAAREAARRVSSDIRQEVVRLIEFRINQAEDNARIQQNQRMTTALDVLARSGYQALTRNTVWTQLTAQQRNSINDQVRQRSEGVAPKTNWVVYARLLELAKTQPDMLKNPEFSPDVMRASLGNTELKEYIKIYTDIQAGQYESAMAAGSLRTSIDDMILQEGGGNGGYGLWNSLASVNSMDRKERTTYSNIQAEVSRTIEAREAAAKRSLTPVERRSVVSDVMLNYALENRNMQPVSGTTPAQLRADWVKYIREVGGTPTGPKVLSLIETMRDTGLTADQKQQKFLEIARGR